MTTIESGMKPKYALIMSSLRAGQADSIPNRNTGQSVVGLLVSDTILGSMLLASGQSVAPVLTNLAAKLPPLITDDLYDIP